jgi:hypothetical protein
MEMQMPRKKIIEVVPVPPVATEEEYQTRDLYFAAYIVSSQRRLKRTERSGYRVTFVFPREAGTLHGAWLDGTGMVSAQSYAGAIRNLKQLVMTDMD